MYFPGAGTCNIFPPPPPPELYCYQTFIMSKSGDKSVDPDPLADTVEKRTRRLTEKALQNYEDQKAVFTKKINTSCEKVNQYLTETVSDTSEVDALNTPENEMKKSFSLYDANVSQYIKYLSRVGTEDSLEQAQVFKTRLEQAQKLVYDFNSILSVLIKSKKQDWFSRVKTFVIIKETRQWFSRAKTFVIIKETKEWFGRVKTFDIIIQSLL